MNKKKNNRIEEQILIKEKNSSSTCRYTHFPAQLRKKIIIVCVKKNVNFSFPNDIIKVYILKKTFWGQTYIVAILAYFICFMMWNLLLAIE